MVITPSKVEQPEPVADSERIKIQRVSLASVRAIFGPVCHRLVSYPNRPRLPILASTMLCAGDGTRHRA
jgi:hypothetical protein